MPLFAPPTSAACFAIMLTLGSWHPPSLSRLARDIDLGDAAQLMDVRELSTGAVVDLDYSSQQTNLTFVQPALLGLEMVVQLNVTNLLQTTVAPRAPSLPNAEELGTTWHVQSHHPTTHHPATHRPVTSASPVPPPRTPTTTLAPTPAPTTTTTTAAPAPSPGPAWLLNLTLEVNISINSGAAIVRTPTPAHSCIPTSAKVSSCSLQPMANVAAALPPQYWFLDSTVKSIVQSVNASLNADLKQSCAWASDMIENALVNASKTTVPPTPLPPSPAGSCNLHNNHLARMAVNVANRLPALFGLSFDLQIVSPTAFHAQLTVDAFAVDPIPLGAAGQVYLPPGTSIEMDIFVGNASCPASNVLQVSESIEILNIRLHNRLRNDGDVLFNELLSSAVADGITDVLRLLFAVEGGKIAIEIPVQEGSHAPVWVMGLVAGGAVLIGIGAAVSSYFYHRDKVVLDKHHNEVSAARRVIGDAIIIVGCCGGIVMFAWSNQTAAAEVRVGGELTLYNFSLLNSIRDMWDAGLYALSIFIAFFCGFYPYFKLLSILVLSVVLQRPQSIILQLIDVVGKFSFLDSFVMIIMAEGLTVPGIAQVVMGPSFWVFLAATCLSIALGNYATHGVRIDANVASASHALQFDDFHDGRTHPILTHGSLYHDEVSMGDAARRTRGSVAAVGAALGFDPNSPRRFRPVIAGVALVLIIATLLVPLLATTVEYKMSGIGALVTGSTSNYSMGRLIIKAPTPLAVLTIVTAFGAPVLFAAGFARTRILAAWVSTDVLCVACLGGLLQLKQFTRFVLGSTFAGLITIDAELHWPIYFLCAAAVVCAALTIRSATYRG